MRSPSSIGQALPSTTVVAPEPSSTKRKAFIVWRCARAFSPGSRIWMLADSVLEVCCSSRCSAMGGTSCSTRRSTTSGEATAMAAEISGRILSHDHRYAASGGGAGRCAFAFSHSGARLASFHALRTSLISGRVAADMARNLSRVDNRRNESLDHVHTLSIATVQYALTVCAKASGDGSVRLTVGSVAL